MSKIVYELPVAPLVEGYDAYIKAGGITRQFLADHNSFKKGDLVYWFDPAEQVSDFAFIDDFKVEGIGEGGQPDVSFILRLRGGEAENLVTVHATIDDIIKIIGVISLGCQWLEEGEEIEDSAEVAMFAVPVGQPTLPVSMVSPEGDEIVHPDYAIIPMWRTVAVDSLLLQNVVEIYNEHCFHYH